MTPRREIFVVKALGHRVFLNPLILLEQINWPRPHADGRESDGECAVNDTVDTGPCHKVSGKLDANDTTYLPGTRNTASFVSETQLSAYLSPVYYMVVTVD